MSSFFSMTRAGAAASRLFIILVCMLLAGVRVSAQDSPDQRLLEALLQEGTLLQEQVNKLQPITAQLDVDRKRLEAEEVQLVDEAANVTKSYANFNAVADELNAATKQQREECAVVSSQFQSEVDSCNSRAQLLRTQGEQLSEQGKELDRQQDDVNRRIVEHNAAVRDWNKRTKEHQQVWAPAIQQVKGWLERFRGFVDSESFAEFARPAGNPAECSTERVGALNPLDPVASLVRAQQCLRALKTATTK